MGGKIAITSSKPQTTRHAIRGLVHRDDAQLVLVDTPGLHKPRTTLGERLNDLVRATWSEVDTVGLCLPADERIGPGDRFLVREIARLRRKPVLAIATKTDLVSPTRLAEHLMAIQRAGDEAGLSGATWCPSPRSPVTRSSCSPTCWSPPFPRARRCTRRDSSPTSRRRPSSPR